MQDLIQESKRRSIRNISIDKPKTVSHTPEPSITDQENMYENPSSPMNPTTPSQPPFGRINSRAPRKSINRWVWIGGGAIILVVAILIIGNIFSGATITLTPRQVAVNLDGSFTASLNPAPGAIGFEVVEVSKEATREVPSVGSETIERPASGTIVIYNDFSEESEKLIVNTRFQTPEGLIFRIQESVTVPGQSTDASGKKVPGSVEAKVFADSAGEKYNIGLSDFTVPAFKEQNDPRQNSFYARSKTPMTGGFSGTVKIASKEDTETAEAAIEAELTESLPSEAQQALPAGFALINEATAYEFETLPNTDGANDSVTITVRGTARALAINAGDLARSTALDRIKGYTGEPVAFSDINSLAFSLEEESIDIASATTTMFRVSGPATLLWTFDIDEMKNRLVGVSRSETTELFSEYPGIEQADVVIRPFWKRSLPDAVEDIEIVIEPAVTQEN